jgi:hypothetical protein
VIDRADLDERKLADASVESFGRRWFEVVCFSEVAPHSPLLSFMRPVQSLAYIQSK